MRYRLEKKPKHGTIRVVNKFLFIPTLVDDEWRWLERVKIKKEYRHFSGWTNIKFIHDEEITSFKTTVRKRRTHKGVITTIYRKH